MPGARVHVVTGKGGVGKSTVALALGRRIAAGGQRALVLDLAPGLGRRAGAGGVGHTPQALGPRIEAAATDADAAIAELFSALSPSRRAAARLLRLPSLRAFLGAAPGVLEVAVLSRLVTLAASGRWDAVVVDADSTGHLRMLLDAPDVLSAVGAAGGVRSTLEAAAALLGDPTRARFHVVTLPTRLALGEAAELVDALSARGLPLGTLFVSRAPPRLEVPRAAAHAFTRRAAGSAAAEDLAHLCAMLDARHALDAFVAARGGRFRRVVERLEDDDAPVAEGASGPSDPAGEDDP